MKPKVSCELQEIENVWVFKYLGATFRADGDQYTDVKVKITKSMSTAGKMDAQRVRQKNTSFNQDEDV